ncbi:MAG: hypothetical protein AAB307_03715 [Deltaproteobacteria bacterium]
MIDVKIQINGIEQVKKLLAPDRFAKVAARALNKASNQAGVEAGRSVRATYNITKARLDKYVTVKSARWEDLSVIISARGKVPGLQWYGARQTSRGTSVLVTFTGGRKVMAHAFIAPGADGKGTGVWVRAGAKVVPMRGRYAGKTSKRTGLPIMRQPLERKFGPSGVSMYKNLGFPVIVEVVQEKFNKVFSQELKWELLKD